MKKPKKKAPAWTGYAVCTRQRDGSWWPWVETIARNRRIVKDNFDATYSSRLGEDPDCKIRRIRIVAVAHA